MDYKSVSFILNPSGYIISTNSNVLFSSKETVYRVQQLYRNNS